MEPEKQKKPTMEDLSLSWRDTSHESHEDVVVVVADDDDFVVVVASSSTFAAWRSQPSLRVGEPIRAFVA